MTYWPSTHPALFAFILFVLAAFISLYPHTIRRFLHDWPNTKEKIRKERVRYLTARLALLNSLHNNAYQLLLFVVWKVSRMLFEMAVMGMFLFVLSVLAKVQLKPSAYLGYLLGSLVGLFGSIGGIAASLYKYDESVQNIEAKLAKLSQPC